MKTDLHIIEKHQKAAKQIEGTVPQYSYISLDAVKYKMIWIYKGGP